jgi:hypothetical protein
VEVQEKDLSSSGGGGAYAALPPGDYEALLKDVEDYDKRDKGGQWGWLWTLEIEGLPFRLYTAFSTGSRWKLVETVRAFDPTMLEEGINEVDPNLFIGMTCGAHVDFRHDPETADPNQPNFKEVKYLFTLPPEERPEAPPAI